MEVRCPTEEAAHTRPQVWSTHTCMAAAAAAATTNTHPRNWTDHQGGPPRRCSNVQEGKPCGAPSHKRETERSHYKKAGRPGSVGKAVCWAAEPPTQATKPQNPPKPAHSTLSAPGMARSRQATTQAIIRVGGLMATALTTALGKGKGIRARANRIMITGCTR